MPTTPKKRGRPAGFKITLKIGDKTFTSRGFTVKEAFEKLPRPDKVTTKGFFTIEGKGMKFERFFMPRELRLFMRPVYAAILAKSISLGLKPLK